MRPGIEFYDFNLQAFHILRKRNGFGDCSKSLIEWLDFFAAANKKSKKEVENVESGVIQKAYGLIEHLPKDVEQETKEFFARLANISIYARALAEEEGKKGEARGMEKGIEIGVEKGREEGIELGEHRKTIAIAKEMLVNESNIAFISRCTGLSIDEINKLKN